MGAQPVPLGEAVLCVDTVCADTMYYYLPLYPLQLPLAVQLG
jgi:hypothetical protein